MEQSTESPSWRNLASISSSNFLIWHNCCASAFQSAWKMYKFIWVLSPRSCLKIFVAWKLLFKMLNALNAHQLVSLQSVFHRQAVSLNSCSLQEIRYKYLKDLLLQTSGNICSAGNFLMWLLSECIRLN